MEQLGNLFNITEKKVVVEMELNPFSQNRAIEHRKLTHVGMILCKYYLN